MNRKYLVAMGLGFAALVVIAGIYWVLVSPEQSAESSSEAAQTSGWPTTLNPWDVERPSESVALLATDTGPQIYVSPKEKVALTPQWKGLHLTWTHTQDDGGITFTGTGDWQGKPAKAVFQFAKGNPQAVFSLTVADATRGTLRTFEDRPKLILPVGDVKILNDQMRIAPFVPAEDATTIDGWTPGWLRWIGQGRTLQFSQWQADETRVREIDGGQIEVTFDVFDRERRLYMEECSDIDDIQTDVSLRYMVTLGKAPMLVPGRFPGGFRAIVAPFFDDPENHPASAYAKNSTKDDAKFAARARTLLMGHSNASDPRHGNGGLAPVHLGGTVGWNGVEGDAVKALRGQLPTGAELVGSDVRVLGECEVDAPKLLMPFAIGKAQAYDSAYRNAITSHASPSRDSIFVPSQLSGERTQLLEQAMSDLYLQRLERERGLFIFSTPFVATRNPLVPAAKDSLLLPERDGQWTLDPALVKALAAMELNAETSALGFTSIGNLARYRAESKNAAVIWGPDGQLRVAGAPTDSTVVVEGAFTPSPDGIRRSDVVDRRQEPQTWVFVGRSDAEVSMGLQPDQQLTPVDWSVSK